jgi:hypothetical protein
MGRSSKSNYLVNFREDFSDNDVKKQGATHSSYMQYKPVASDGVHMLISPPGYLNTFQL